MVQPRERLSIFATCRLPEEVKADLRPRLANRLAEADRRAAGLAEFSSMVRDTLSHLDTLPDRAEPCDAQCTSLLGSGPAPVPVPVWFR